MRYEKEFTLRDMAQAVINSRPAAEVFISRYMSQYRVNRQAALKQLKEWNIQIKKLPEN